MSEQLQLQMETSEENHSGEPALWFTEDTDITKARARYRARCGQESEWEVYEDGYLKIGPLPNSRV